MKRRLERMLALGLVWALAAACATDSPQASGAEERSAPRDAGEPAAAAGQPAPDGQLMELLSSVSAASTRAQEATPLWDRTFTLDDYNRLYPTRPLNRSVTGTVMLECLIGFDGRLDCEIASEMPRSWGFGSAAMSLADILRAGPRMSDGNPSANETVDIEFQFNYVAR